MTRLLTEFGQGTSLRRGDYTEAACRAVRDALWHNSINLAELFGFPKDAMQIRVDVGVQQPGQVDNAKVAAEFPYGTPVVRVVEGGARYRASGRQWTSNGRRHRRSVGQL